MSFTARYLDSATNKNNWPENDLPEILLVGRSNVGKSSLLNNIFHNKKLAYVGKTPGKTQMLNFFTSEALVFVDAPGYGFANRSKEQLMVYQQLMEDYLQYRQQLRFIIWILDIRRIPNADDLLMLQWLQNSHHDFLIILNKADKLSNNENLNQKTRIAKTLNVSVELLLLYSAKSSLGQEILLEKLTELAYN